MRNDVHFCFRGFGDNSFNDSQTQTNPQQKHVCCVAEAGWMWVYHVSASEELQLRQAGQYAIHTKIITPSITHHYLQIFCFCETSIIAFNNYLINNFYFILGKQFSKITKCIFYYWLFDVLFFLLVYCILHLFMLTRIYVFRSEVLLCIVYVTVTYSHSDHSFYS